MHKMAFFIGLLLFVQTVVWADTPPATQAASAPRANESVVYDDGTGAKIDFYLPTRGTWQDKSVEYGIFRISVHRDGKLLLLADLSGAPTADGKFFHGSIIIPSELVASARMLAIPGPGSASSLGDTKFVRDFQRIARPKCWTDGK